MARFALIAAGNSRPAQDAVVAFARAAFANSHEVTIIGGTGLDGLRPGGAPDPAFDPGDYDHIWALTAAVARDYQASADLRHASDVDAAGPMDGAVIVGDADPATASAAVASGAPVACLTHTMPAALAAEPALAGCALDTDPDERRNRAVPYLIQKFVADHS